MALPDDDRPEAGPLLTEGDLLGPVDVVAPSLLGSWVVTDRPEGRVALRLTEVEAYSGEGLDPASHADRGPTPRAEIMFQLSRMHVRWHRHGHVNAARVYRGGA